MKRISYFALYLSLTLVFISSQSFAQTQKTWSVVMAKNTGLHNQTWYTRAEFPSESIQQSRNEGKYVSDLAYGGDRWVVATSKGTGYSNQKWYTRTYFPQSEIKKAWDEGFYITKLVYGEKNGEGVWALIVSKNTSYTQQKWYTRSYFPQDEIKESWDEGYYINSVTYGNGLWALVLSKGSNYTSQKWYTRTYFPKEEIKKGWDEGFDITSLTYGDGHWVLIMSKGTGFTDQRWYTSKDVFPKEKINEGWDKGFSLMGIYAGYEKTAEEPEAKPLITWQEPAANVVTSTEKSYRIKLCIESESDIVAKKVYVNGQLSRGFEVVKATDGCTEMLDQTIELVPGNNKIKVMVTNSGGTTTSEVHSIRYQKPAVVNNNPVRQEKRVALIIGNGDYETSPLRNPANDAEDMAKELEAQGFEVLEHIDASHEEMELAVLEFGKKIKNGGVGLFYYAGHGIQFDGNNYLVPVDAKIESETEVKFRSLNLGLVLAKMEDADNRMNIVILDACRNNPFKRSWRSAEEGLATTISPTGTFIAYATSPGSVAADGTGENGLYTQELLKAMKTPNTKLEDVFKKVRSNVRKLSGGKQVPWESSSIEGDFFFRKK